MEYQQNTKIGFGEFGKHTFKGVNILNRSSRQDYPSPRRERAYVSILGTTQMHLRNPVIIALWSAIFPGMGHMLLSKYLRGFILFTWEITVNVYAHINMAIFLTFTGRFEEAKQVLDTRWLLLYIPMYLFAIWDSYRTAADLNNQFLLAAREDAPIKSFMRSEIPPLYGGVQIRQGRCGRKIYS